LNKKRGKPSLSDKFLMKRNNDKRVGINVTIPQSLLIKVEAKIVEKNRSRKLVACIRKGYEVLTGAN